MVNLFFFCNRAILTLPNTTFVQTWLHLWHCSPNGLNYIWRLWYTFLPLTTLNKSGKFNSFIYKSYLKAWCMSSRASDQMVLHTTFNSECNNCESFRGDFNNWTIHQTAQNVNITYIFTSTIKWNFYQYNKMEWNHPIKKKCIWWYISTLNSNGQESLKCPVTQQVNKLLTSTQTKIIIVSTNSHSISGN